MQLPRILTAAVILVGTAAAAPLDDPDGHFSTWQEIPAIIDSISESSAKAPLEKLHQLTLIKLGFPQSSVCLSDENHRRFMLQTKRNWTQWWESTGKPVAELKKHDAGIDPRAFQCAWKFLGSPEQPPDPIPPVWIPATWTLAATYSNGDYRAREKELWIITRKADSASLLRLRGEYGQPDWQVALSELDTFTPSEADQLLKTLHYLHHLAPAHGTKVADDAMKRTYYPHSTLHLRDGAERILWNTEGYEFTKTRPEFGDGESGLTYYFLRSAFPNGPRWKPLPDPAGAQLAPFVRQLTYAKPCSQSLASEIVILLGKHGGALERRALLDWAEKEMAATAPNMDWPVCCDDFGANSKENVINLTRNSLQKTRREIQRIGARLRKQPGNPQDAAASDEDQAREVKLDQYITRMLATEKKEQQDSIDSYPQPLRQLIIADEHPEDSDLKILSAAVQSVRNAPDPKLFAQLVTELHEGTLRINSLLTHILLNDNDMLDLKPWGAKEEQLAVNSCIDALPLAKEDAREHLIEILLRVCGGGKIEIQDENGGQSIEVKVTGNGHQLTLSEASHPLSIPDVQRQLRRMYAASKAKPVTPPPPTAPRRR